MGLFGSAKKEGAPLGVPTDKVLSMRQQGLSNNQIIQNLQTSGHEPNQIFDALNQADLKGSIESMIPPEMPSDLPSNPMDFAQPLPQPVFAPPPADFNQGPPDMAAPSWGGQAPGVDRIDCLLYTSPSPRDS